ncbi:N-acetylglucosamine-6-phosphate deacetylase [Virgibacillus profundi]|uniref:N-acetylglucosamine-6-phosphate deacetylase n=1 Tax=Virgibacillus profundi TaxID=2024555 RepID=A0A2A2IGX2_9BACI|nr:amidohydrolase family protein [Virgibacillus profundi]PAV31251.1 N-acetylglucosamine-6-phosphate deacetylase [Virgibacillus profundi]PXY55436.1 N-acetylglucosamine-6-phosphate deacetylase [Virgibacillus profundi]
MNEYLEGIHYVTGEQISVTFEGSMISDIKRLSNQKKEFLPYIAPGLVDLQINGYQGNDFNSLPITREMVKKVTTSLWKEGVTSYFPTIITNSDEAIESAVQVISETCENDSFVEECIAGIHVEGPFISTEDGPRGAHSNSYVKAPDWSLFQRWQEAAKGRIKIITISPEWPGSAEFISKCTENGVTVSIGHTAATPEQIQEAVKAGAKMSTHLGNGAHLMLPRHPNYIWEQLAEDNLWSCIIADGFHLPDSFLKVAISAKKSQSILVSDAVYLSGLEPGDYETHIGGKVVLTPEGKLHMKENPKLLAGSVKMLKDGIAHLSKSGVCSIQEAWEMASVRPSTFMKLPVMEGLKEGENADLVTFTREKNSVKIVQTYKSGKLVYTS